jgi:hypothetical protein
MTDEPFDYRKAYDAARRELATLLEQQKMIEKRLLSVRTAVQTLAVLSESEGIEIDPSPEASYLLVKVTLADEIRLILRAIAPQWVRPNEVKNQLARLGHDMSKYQNPQATIHMVLKRMAGSGEIEEQSLPDSGKQAYRWPLMLEQVGKQIRNAPRSHRKASQKGR